VSHAGILERWLQALEDYPLYQLVKLKLGRMLYGAEADSEDMDTSIGTALAVLALPGAFLSLLLFNKYGSLLRLLRGQVNFNPYASSLPDEYLFIVLAIVVAGGVALWKWDTLFLDRRDTLNIVPLPLHTRQICVANLLAILLFALIFCIDVNAGSAVLFPMVVSASQESLLFFGKIALGHVVAVAAASLFSLTAVFAIAGCFMAVLPPRAFQATSLYLRALIAAGLLILFVGSFGVSQEIATGAADRNSAVGYLPSMWFLGICQWARGAADASFRHLAFLGAVSLLATITVCALAYGFAYQRHFSRMAEVTTERRTGRSYGVGAALGHLLDRTLLRTPFEQAGFRFIVRTLGRSDRHRVAMAVFLATGVVVASESLLSSREHSAAPGVAEFAAPLIILYCCILGLRSAFDIPVELNANWSFRFLIAPTLEEPAVLAGKAMFLLVVPLILGASVIFALRWDIFLGLLQCVLLGLLSASMIAVLVLNFRKLPFTCAKAGFQHNAIVKVLLCVLGGFIFAMLPAAVEHWARSQPLRLLVLLPLLIGVWWGIYEGRSAQLDIERQIVFRDSPQNEFELLKLSG
jgi:hypothetical protein